MENLIKLHSPGGPMNSYSDRSGQIPERPRADSLETFLLSPPTMKLKMKESVLTPSLIPSLTY